MFETIRRRLWDAATEGRPLAPEDASFLAERLEAAGDAWDRLRQVDNALDFAGIERAGAQGRPLTEPERLGRLLARIAMPERPDAARAEVLRPTPTIRTRLGLC